MLSATPVIRTNGSLSATYLLVFAVFFVRLVRSSEFSELPSGSMLAVNGRLDVDEMTGGQMLDYIRWDGAINSSIRGGCRIQKDFGPGSDGKKSVCVDQSVKPEPGNCLAYYFGLNVDHLERYFIQNIANYGCQVYVFDPLANRTGRLRELEESSKIHVYPIGLSYKSEKSSPVTKWTLMPLSRIVQQLDHSQRTIDYLRLDMEDWHPRTLAQIASSGSLKRIRQLSVEIHIVPEGTTDELRNVVEVLRALEEQLGMIRFASNGIPSSSDWLEPLRFDGCLDYEISWLNGSGK